jgi:hypothetical protein
VQLRKKDDHRLNDTVRARLSGSKDSHASRAKRFQRLRAQNYGIEYIPEPTYNWTPKEQSTTKITFNDASNNVHEFTKRLNRWNGKHLHMRRTQSIEFVRLVPWDY